MATKEQVMDALKQVLDPELMVNVVDLGLIYNVTLDEAAKKVAVDMTMTSPACPVGPQLVQQAKMAVERLEGVEQADIQIVMSPPWTPDKMSDEGRDQLGIY